MAACVHTKAAVAYQKEKPLMADQTGLDKTLQSNADQYNPDTTQQQAAYAALKKREQAGIKPDTTQISAIRTRRKVR